MLCINFRVKVRYHFKSQMGALLWWAPNAGGRGLIHGQGTKIMRAEPRKIPHVPEKIRDPERCS